MNDKDYKKVLKQLKKDEDLFIKFINIIKPENENQLVFVRDYMENFSKKDEVGKIVYPIVSKLVLDLVTSKPKYKWAKKGTKAPKILKTFKNILTDEVRRSVIEIVKTPMKEWYPYAKKDVVNVSIPWINSEEEALSIAKLHHRIINVKNMNILLTKISDGTNNPTIGKLLEKSPSYKAGQLKKLDLTDTDQRHKFINSIAQTPSLLKLLNNIQLTITLDDLKKLPPVRRFNFLQYLYEPSLGYRYSGRYYGNINGSTMKKAIKRFGGTTRLPMDKIKTEDLKQLLFSVSFRKNDEVNVWWDRYKQYANFMSKKGNKYGK